MSKIRRIEISFPEAIELPDGLEQTLCALIDMACKKYEAANPTMVMWVAGIGSKITRMPIMAGDERMEFDDNTLAFDCCAREDFYGENPANPDRERLRDEAAAARRERKLKSQPS